MISIVNGYVCMTSCEVASAKQDRDPSAPLGTPPGVWGKDHKTSAFSGEPATIFGGALTDIATANSVAAADAAQQPRLDRLA